MRGDQRQAWVLFGTAESLPAVADALVLAAAGAADVRLDDGPTQPAQAARSGVPWSACTFGPAAAWRTS
jgi:hypothetical protein